MRNPIVDLVGWWRRNSELHGVAMLLLTAFIYAGQGGRSYVDSTLDYVGQYQLNGTSAELQSAKAVGKYPWSLKFLIGLISDNLPIMGYNVKPYMVLFAILGVVGHVMLGLKFLSNNLGGISFAYIIIQFYGAAADCLADALVIKNGRHDEEDSTSGLQSLSWFSLGVGGAIFTIVGSQMSTDFTGANDGVNADGSRLFTLLMTTFPVFLIVFMFFLTEEKTKITPGFKALFQQLVRLAVALFSPPFLVLRVAAWIFLSNMANVSISSAFTPFTISVLGITPDISGWIDVSSYAFLSIGVVIYYAWFRHTSFRVIFLWSQILTAIIYLTDYVLVKRWNQAIGLPDVPFLITSGAFSTVIDRLNSMPFLVMAGQLCPENMEATFFALMMSISNQGSAQASNIGAELLKAYGVNKKNFDNLPTVILIRSACIVGICIFIWLLPNTAALSPTNIETLRPTNPTIIRILKYADLYHPEDHAEKGDQKEEVVVDDIKKN